MLRASAHFGIDGDSASSTHARTRGAIPVPHTDYRDAGRRGPHPPRHELYEMRSCVSKSARNTPETILRVAVCRDVVRTCAHIDTAHSQAHELAPSNTHLRCLPPSQSNEQ